MYSAVNFAGLSSPSVTVSVIFLSLVAIGVDLAGIPGDAWRAPKLRWCQVG